MILGSERVVSQEKHRGPTGFLIVQSFVLSARHTSRSHALLRLMKRMHDSDIEVENVSGKCTSGLRPLGYLGIYRSLRWQSQRVLDKRGECAISLSIEVYIRGPAFIMMLVLKLSSKDSA